MAEAPESNPRAQQISDKDRRLLDQSVQQASMAAREISEEAAGEVYPSSVLTSDLWPPLFTAGTRVFFQPVPVDAIDVGHFVLARIRGYTMICRYLDWSYNGTTILANVRPPGQNAKAETVVSNAIIGRIVKISRNGVEMDPHKSSLLDKLTGFLTGYGTVPVHVRLGQAVGEILAVARAPKEKKDDRGSLGSMLKEIRVTEEVRKQEEAEQAEAQERQKAWQEEAALPAPPTPTEKARGWLQALSSIRPGDLYRGTVAAIREIRSQTSRKKTPGLISMFKQITEEEKQRQLQEAALAEEQERRKALGLDRGDSITTLSSRPDSKDLLSDLGLKRGD